MNKMKMILLLTVLFSVMSCSKSEQPITAASTIIIGNYRFTFPPGFELIPGQGIDSYIGTIDGAGISLFFDYGIYTSPLVNLPANEYTIFEDEFNGHFRQIVKPIDPVLQNTSLHLYKLSDVGTGVLGHNSLTLSTQNITAVQQELLISVFTNVVLIE